MSESNSTLTQKALREWLDYSPTTGVFTWKKDRKSAKIGDHPRSADKDGYLRVGLLGKTHKLHRLAFLYVTGQWPTGQVDHIDGDRANNKWSNLRDVDASTNQQNKNRAFKGAKVGLLGVSQPKGRDRYSARISVDGERMFLGWFATAEEAHQAYMSAKRIVHAGCTA